MNEQEVYPEGRKAILCDKDRCRWRAGLCPPFRGSRCPFGGGTITYVEGTGVESLVYIMQFPINEDHSGNGIDGKYQLNIIINTNLT